MGYPIYHSQYTAAQIENAIGKGPRVNASGYWEVWDVSTGAYVSTGVGAGVTAPFVVTTASQMTDTGKIYIYNGTETGYQAGYWYYYNGSAWVPGGIYQVAGTDKTLTVADANADAKVTGDCIRELQTDVDAIDELYTHNIFDADVFLAVSGITKTDGILSGTVKSFGTAFSTGVPMAGEIKADTQYTIRLKTYTTGTSAATRGFDIYADYSDNTSEVIASSRNNDANWTTRSGVTAAGKTVVKFHTSYYAKPTNVVYIEYISITEGAYSAYEPYQLTAVDRTARDQIAEMIGTPKDLMNGITTSYDDGYWSAVIHLDPGVYTLSMRVETDNTARPYSAVAFLSRSYYGDSFVVDTKYVPRSRDILISLKLTQAVNSIFIFAGSIASSSGSSITVTGLHIYPGVYVPADTGKDVTRSVQFALEDEGHFTLGKGEYEITNLIMPPGSTLKGAGEATVIRPTEYAVEFELASPVSESTSGYVVPFNLNNDYGGLKLPAGFYKVTVNVSTPYERTSVSRVSFVNQYPYSGSQVIESLDVARDTDVTFTVFLDESIGSVFVFAGTAVTYEGDVAVTVNSFRMELEQAAVAMQASCTVRDITFNGAEETLELSDTLGDTYGVIWANPDNKYGILSGCRFTNFDGAAILLQDTGTPVEHALEISDCWLYNNNRAIFNRQNSEFNKIVNCGITRNYYGIIIRGGNNNIANCGIDGNVVGISVDSDEGSNGGHGAITNCSINHSNANNGYGLIIKGVGLEIVNNCNFYYSDIRIENTKGNIISNCGFGTGADIQITGGTCSIIEGCMFRSSDNKIYLYNNTAAKVHNCYLRSGTEVTPTVSDVPI